MPARAKHDSPPRELARRIVAEMSRARFAPAFLDGYAREFNRFDVVAHLERRRELEAIISREILLAIASRIAITLEELNAPPRGHRMKRGARPSLLWNPGTFVRELAAAISRESGWTLGDSVDFQGDLQIYLSLSKPPAAGRSSSGRNQVARHRSPFVDRCAIVLDPSMLENASRAAAKLLVRVDSLADHLLKDLPTQKK
jgi:hypothetical protein